MIAFNYFPIYGLQERYVSIRLTEKEVGLF